MSQEKFPTQHDKSIHKLLVAKEKKKGKEGGVQLLTGCGARSTQQRDVIQSNVSLPAGANYTLKENLPTDHLSVLPNNTNFCQTVQLNKLWTTAPLCTAICVTRLNISKPLDYRGDHDGSIKAIISVWDYGGPLKAMITQCGLAMIAQCGLSFKSKKCIMWIMVVFQIHRLQCSLICHFQQA